MDVAPEAYEDWYRTQCSGPSRRCMPGNTACVEAAQEEGFDTQVGLYAWCRAEDVSTVPGRTAYYAVAALVIAAIVIVAIRRRQAPAGR